MTEIHVNLAEFRIEAEGHAGQAEAGQDIVCAGISAVMLALLNVLVEEEEKRMLELDWSKDDETGTLRIHVIPIKGIAVITAYFRMAVMGLKAIEQHYGDHIKVIEEGQENGDV